MSEPATDDGLITSPQAEYDALRHVSPETACPYLPGRLARSEVYHVEVLDGGSYERMLAHGFRRSGRIVYRPRCRGCRECRQLRIAVAEFRPGKSLRRVCRRNADVRVQVDLPVPSYDKYLLFRRYLEHQHDQTMSRDYETFVEFLYDSPMDTIEIRYYVDDRLMGVSLIDRCSDGLSSVYMFYDPEFARRSPGTFSILWEIDYCRRQGLAYYYLGYYVAGSRTMDYKARFRPNQVLVGKERWVNFAE